MIEISESTFKMIIIRFHGCVFFYFWYIMFSFVTRTLRGGGRGDFGQKSRPNFVLLTPCKTREEEDEISEWIFCDT